MSDSLPTISADQLTKAVNLAAAGTLSALELENADDGWHNNDSTSQGLKNEGRLSSQSSLQLLETLSTSVTSSLGKINQLAGTPQYPSRNPSASSLKSKHNGEASLPTLKKYSSRKNYKLMPPLIPSQVQTNFRKPTPKAVLQKQLVTLSHHPNLSPQELKSLPVRPARYTTNYLFVRTTSLVPTPQGANSTNEQSNTPVSESNGMVLVPQSALKSSDSPGMTSSPGEKHPVLKTSVISPCPSGAGQGGTQVLHPLTVSMGSTHNTSLTPPVAVSLEKPSTQLLPSPNVQPVLRLPFSLHSVPSNIIMSPKSISKEGNLGNEEITASPGSNAKSNDKLQKAKLSSNQISAPNPQSSSPLQAPVTAHPSQSMITNSPNVKHFLVPVSPSSSVPVITTTTRPVQLSTSSQAGLTPVFPTNPNLASPQAVLLTQRLPTSSQQHAASKVNNIVLSPGHFVIAGTRFHLVATSNAATSPNTSGKPPVAFATATSGQDSHPGILSAEQLLSGDQSGAKGVIPGTSISSNVHQVTPQMAVKSPHSVSQMPVSKSNNISLASNVGNTTVKTSSLPVFTTTSQNGASSIKSNNHEATKPAIVSISLSSPNSECTRSSSSLLKPVTATVIAVQTGGSGTFTGICKVAKPSIPVTMQSKTSVTDKEKSSSAFVLAASDVTASPKNNITEHSPLAGATVNPTFSSNGVKVYQTSSQAASVALRALHQHVQTRAPSASSSTITQHHPVKTKSHLGDQAPPQNLMDILKDPSSTVSRTETIPQHSPVKDSSKPLDVYQTAKPIIPSAGYQETAAQLQQPGAPQNQLTYPSPSAAMAADLMSNVPLSKAAAAAAMVSLASIETFAKPAPQMFTSSAQSAVRMPSKTPVSPQMAPAQFLVPSPDGKKLVISSDGIRHLQSLLRKQGISEGYFVITSPRAPPAFSAANHRCGGNTMQTKLGSGDVNQDSKIKELPQQKPEVKLSSPSSEKTLPIETFMQTVPAKPSPSNSIVHLDHKADIEEKINEDSDESDNEMSSSSDSRSSSAALVIETGEEEEEKMDSEDPVGDLSSEESKSPAGGNVTSKPTHSVSDDDNVGASASTVAAQKHLQHDTAWEMESIQSDHGRQCVPQSPLSLCDLVRQQQNRTILEKQLDYNFLSLTDSKVKETDVSNKTDASSPQLPTSDNQDFHFPMPVCPASAYCASGQQQQTDTEVQASFHHSPYTPSSSFSNDLNFDSNAHHPAAESRHGQHQGESSSTISAKMLSNHMSAASPKSPLSVNSSQAVDHSAPLNPPMTPNTMLINLLNRVPTPLLTNHQDLLSAPTSQENQIHDSDVTPNYHMNENKAADGLYLGKNLAFSSNVNQIHMDASQATSENFLYTDGNRSLPNHSETYSTAQNALELIASNYSSTRGNHAPGQEADRPHLASDFSIADSKSYDQNVYNSDLQVGGETEHYLQNYQQGGDSHDACHNFHCKSCSGPLLVTVNLDSDTPTYAVNLQNVNGEKVSESLLDSYEHPNVFQQSIKLHETHCTQDGTEVTSHTAFEKSSETDILRHLILNTTSSSSFHTLQPVQSLNNQHFDNSQAPTYNIPQQDNQFECRVESFLEPENPHKTLSGTNIDQSGAFPTQEESFLHLSHVHARPSPSFNASNTSFKDDGFQNTAHQPFENTAGSSFENETNAAMGNQANSSFDIQAEMANGASFTVQDMAKSGMPLSHNFMNTDTRLQHLPGFRSDDHEAEMFFQHSHQQQANLHHSHYDPGQSHGMEYHIDNLPPAPQPHEYSNTSLSHPDSSRMFSDPVGNVGYMNGQYPPQYYDSGSVASDLPMFSQQCVVGSEAPVLGSTARHPCSIQFSSAPSGLQLQFRFPSEEEEGNNIEKQPVLPSASFSPPSVADQAATPDSGGMSMYNGTFPNLSMYDLYMRGGNADARVPNEGAPETGNFCVECNIMYKNQCKFHSCDYTYVSDTPILSHARLTLPSCLKLGTSSIVGHTNNTGAFAKEKIAMRTKFGPLIGSPVSCDKLGSTRSFTLWQTFTGNNTKVVDTSDENSSNWLMFVKPARVSMEQNLVAFQHGNSVYFVTRMDIEPGQELLYWFAKDYARMLGITAKPRNARHQLCPHCTVCKQVFPDLKQVRSHQRVQHPKPCNKKCSHCPRRFTQVSHLNVHIMSVHLRVQKFVCPQCGKKFCDSSNFRKHVKTHSDERNHKCQICGKDFRQKSHLKHHMNIHLPVKNEQCGFCGVRFTRAFTRRQHELQHTKQNKIQCTQCDKVFYKQKIYKQHLKTHRNERKYVCSHCSKAFRSKSDLNRHLLTCKQRKCIVMPPPPPPPSLNNIHPLPPPPPPPPPQASQMPPGEFLHANQADVSLPAFDGEVKTTRENV